MRHPKTPGRAAAALLFALSGAPAGAQTVDELFDDRSVQEIRLEMHPSDWQRLHATVLENTYYPCDLRWRGMLVQDVGVRSRGGSTRNPVKPGLRLDFNRYEPHQEFLGLKSLHLRNVIQDASLLKDRVSMRMFRRLGLSAPRSVHARLYVNDRYAGLYELVESVDKRFLQAHFGEDGGYLYQYDLGPEYHFEYLGPDRSRYVPFPFDPKTHETDPDPQPLIDMIRVINQSSDADFVRAVGEFLDLKLFVTYVAVEMFLAEGDGVLGNFGLNNFYLYRSQRNRRFQFIPWDKDLTFLWPEYPIWQNTRDNVLTRRALAVPELRFAFLDALRMMVVLAGGQDGWLEQEISRLAGQIGPAALEDGNRQCWSPQGFRTCANGEFEEGVQELRRFARKRGDYVLAELSAAGYRIPDEAPRLALGGAVNAASGAPALAPGSLATLYGSLLGNATAAAGLPLPAVLEGVAVYINGFAAPLVFVSPGQLNLQTPWEITPGTAPVTAVVKGVMGNTIAATIRQAAPGIFLTAHANGRVVSPAAPMGSGDLLLVYATGLGAVSSRVGDGEPAPGEPLAFTLEKPAVSIGGVAAEVLFSGLAPGFAGLYQVNARMPPGVEAGPSVPLTLQVGELSASATVSTQ